MCTPNARLADRPATRSFECLENQQHARSGSQEDLMVQPWEHLQCKNVCSKSIYGIAAINFHDGYDPFSIAQPKS